MKNFLITFPSSFENMEKMKTMSSEDKMKEMKIWEEWFSKYEKHVVDFGNPLGEGYTINAKKEVKPLNDNMSGYSILKAKDKDELISILKNHPHQNNSNDPINFFEIIELG